MQKKCSKCNSFKITSLAGICIGVIGLSFVVGFFGLFFFPFLFIAGFFLVVGMLGMVSQIILKLSNKPTQQICLNCHYSWEE